MNCERSVRGVIHCRMANASTTGVRGAGIGASIGERAALRGAMESRSSDNSRIGSSTARSRWRLRDGDFFCCGFGDMLRERTGTGSGNDGALIGRGRIDSIG